MCVLLTSMGSISRLVVCHPCAWAEQSKSHSDKKSLISFPAAHYPSRAGARQPQRVWRNGVARGLGCGVWGLSAGIGFGLFYFISICNLLVYGLDAPSPSARAEFYSLNVTSLSVNWSRVRTPPNSGRSVKDSAVNAYLSTEGCSRDSDVYWWCLDVGASLSWLLFPSSTPAPGLMHLWHLHPPPLYPHPHVFISSVLALVQALLSYLASDLTPVPWLVFLF